MALVHLYEAEVPVDDQRILELYAVIPVLIDWYQREEGAARRHLRLAALAYLEELEDIYPPSREFVASARTLLDTEGRSDA